MTLMNIMDSVFYLGLVITFLLILLVVYHFKNRVTTMEQRCDTMFEIMNNIVQELNILRRQQKMTMGGVDQANITTTVNEHYASGQQASFDYKDDEEEESGSEYETDDEEEEENSELSDNDLEEDEEEEKVVELTNDIVEDDSLKQVQVSDSSPLPEGTPSSLMEIDDNSSIKIEKVETNLEDELPEEDNDTDSKMDAYKSMTNSALKALVIEKGLSTNPSKLKKSELLDLLKELE
jgi:hypothetical protein